MVLTPADAIFASPPPVECAVDFGAAFSRQFGRHSLGHGPAFTQAQPQLARRPHAVPRRHRNRASLGSSGPSSAEMASFLPLNSIAEEIPRLQIAPPPHRRVILARRSLSILQQQQNSNNSNNFGNLCVRNNNHNASCVADRRRTIDGNYDYGNGAYGADAAARVNAEVENRLAAGGIGGFQAFRWRQAPAPVTAAMDAARRSPLKNVSVAFASRDNIPRVPLQPQHQQQQQPLQQRHQQQQLLNFAAVATVAAAQVEEEREEMAARKSNRERDERVNERFLQRAFVPADVDKAVHLDERALAALLRTEKSALANVAQFKALQCEIGEALRRTAVTHMYEVSLRENADLVVFPLAVSYMDRILSVQFVPRRNLGALADASLFLAMKMKAPQPPKAYHVVDGCKSRLEQLQDWEMFIVNKLEWNLSTSTAFEFFDQLMVRAPILETLRESFVNTLNITLKDLQLACLAPSLQAAACLLYVADESRKTHLIRESEAVIRKCFGVDAAHCRFQYTTNIRFALSDFFFDDDEEPPIVVVDAKDEEVKNQNRGRDLDGQEDQRELSDFSFNDASGSTVEEMPTDVAAKVPVEKNQELSSPRGSSREDDDNGMQMTLICEESLLPNDSDSELDGVTGAEGIEAEEEDDDMEMMIIIPNGGNSCSPFYTSPGDDMRDRQFPADFYAQLDPAMRKATKRPLSLPTFRVCGDPTSAPLPKSATIARMLAYADPATTFSHGSDDGIHTDENSNSSDGYTVGVRGTSTAAGNDSGFSTSTVSTPESVQPPDTTALTTTATMCTATATTAMSCAGYSDFYASLFEF